MNSRPNNEWSPALNIKSVFFLKTIRVRGLEMILNASCQNSKAR